MNTLETHPVNQSTNKPTPDIRIKDVTVFVDPFEEFLKQKRTEEQTLQNKAGAAGDEDQTSRGRDDEQMTWTGKRVRDSSATTNNGAAGGVGKYLKAAMAERQDPEEDEIVAFVDDDPEPTRKKFKATGGFGDFSSWS